MGGYYLTDEQFIDEWKKIGSHYLLPKSMQCLKEQYITADGQ